MKVGIFDSGIGGLSVLHRALREMPGVQFIYYADEAHVPYGEKSVEQIKTYIDEIIEFMLDRQVDAIVIACNTATSVATREYRSRFPVPIIGMEPAVKKAVELYPKETDRVLVAATPVTIAGDKLHDLIEKVHQRERIDLVALPELVRFAEQGDFQAPEIGMYLREALRGYPIGAYKAFVLGCTHFNYFKEHYREIFPRKIRFVDGNGGTIRQLLRSLPGKSETGGAAVDESCKRLSQEMGAEYYFSGRAVTEEEYERICGYMRQLDQMYDL